MGKFYRHPYAAATKFLVAATMKKARHSKRYTQMLRTLRATRKEAGFTQAEVGKKFGSHASFVSKCETGERRIDVVELAEFCQIYGVDVVEFIKSAGIA